MRTPFRMLATNRRRSAGFTLIEMLIVVALMAILAAIAAPSMADMIRVQRLRTATFDVFAALSLARSEAIKRNVSVTIVPVGGEWMNGWVSSDTHGNVVQRQEAYTSCGTCSIVGPPSVVYASSGRITSAPPRISLTATNLTSDKFRCVIVEASGRPVTMQGVCV